MPGAEPMRTAIPITDVVTGLYAAIGVLHHRRETGEGQHVDAAMLDASVALNGHLALGFLMNGQVPARVGNTNPTRHRELALRLPHSRGVDVPSLRSPHPPRGCTGHSQRTAHSHSRSATYRSARSSPSRESARRLGLARG